MTSIIQILFTQECLNELEDLFYNKFYCNTYIGYENVLNELSDSFDSNCNIDFTNIELQEVLDNYLLFTETNYTIDDHIMSEIVFHSVITLFVNIVIIQKCKPPAYKFNILHEKFILPITGNINISNLIKQHKDKIDHVYGEDIYKEYGWNEYLTYVKEELSTYIEFNSQPSSILK